MTTRGATSSGDEPVELTWRSVSATLDAGEQNCATLVLNVRKAIQAIEANGILAVVAYDPSAELDLQAWCRMTGHRYRGKDEHERFAVYYLEKSGA